MPRSLPIARTLVLMGGLLAVCGCSDVPQGPPHFQLDPQKVTDEAMRLYDKNQDGKLDAKELEASPPLEDMLKNLQFADHSHPEFLTADDISARIKQWNASPANLMEADVRIFLDGKPLPGATVVYEPEPFLGTTFHQKHQAQTNEFGGAALGPSDNKDFPGVYVGLYRVSVSKIVGGKETVPEKYNAKTVLGIELATNVRNARTNGTFKLTSK